MCHSHHYRYIGALPLALGVRSTNVYEDRSIALFEEEISDDSEFDMHVLPGSTKAEAWGKYMVCHILQWLIQYEMHGLT